nr:hypothetical protein [Tanacetum cinerariifolium]
MREGKSVTWVWGRRVTWNVRGVSGTVSVDAVTLYRAVGEIGLFGGNGGYREELEALWSLVKERFSTTKPKNFSDDFLLIITFTTTQLIFLVERKYPLTRFTLDQMLNAVRLKVEEESEVSLKLLSFGVDAAKEFKKNTLDQMLNAVRLKVEEESKVSLELLRKMVQRETTRSQNHAYKSPPLRPAGHKPHGPPMRAIRSNMNGARPKRTSARLLSVLIILKDPVSEFSTEWYQSLVRRFDLQKNKISSTAEEENDEEKLK